MRHRRRIQNTQITKKRQHTVSRSALPRQAAKSRGPLYIIILLIAAGSAFLLFTDTLSLPGLELFSDKTTVLPRDEATRVNTPSEQAPALPLKEEEVYSPIQRQIQLEILNGCGVKGIADRLTRLLQKHNYDVVNKGNYLKKGKVDWNVSETRIIDQIGKVDNARQLADAMGVLYSNVESYENPSPIADITIIIGKDYKTLPIFNHQE